MALYKHWTAPAVRQIDYSPCLAFLVFRKHFFKPHWRSVSPRGMQAFLIIIYVFDKKGSQNTILLKESGRISWEAYWTSSPSEERRLGKVFNF